MQNLQHVQHSCQDCQMLFGSRVHNALAWMFVNFHAKLQASKIVHGGTPARQARQQILLSLVHALKLAQIFWPWHPAKGSQIGVSLAVTDLPLFSSWTLHKSCTIHKSLWAQLPWRNAHPFYHWGSIYKHLQTASSVANVYLRTLRALKLLGDYPINGLDKTNHSRQKHFLVCTCCCEAGPTASL